MDRWIRICYKEKTSEIYQKTPIIKNTKSAKDNIENVKSVNKRITIAIINIIVMTN